MKTILIILTLLIASCTKEETVAFGFQIPEALPDALKKLENENIWYKKLNDGRYEVYVKDIQKIQKIYGEEVNKIIPPYRSVQYHPDILAIIEKKLKKRNIPYKIRLAENEKWLVWEEENEEEVKKIATEATDEASKKWFQEK